jgi:phosphoglycolate phosphatase-like HAD superfamily hydrolase
MSHVRQEFDAYLFDIDGTLLHARDGVHMGAMAAATRDVWQSTRPLEEVPIHGNTDIGILRAIAELDGIGTAEFDTHLPEAIAVMRRYLEEHKQLSHPVLCPFIVELLTNLRERGKLMGLSTGNIDTAGWLKTRTAGIAEFFTLASFSNEHEKREGIFAWAAEQARTRLGSKARVVFLGDTPNDVRAAQYVGEPVIALATGHYSREMLHASGPCHLCLENCGELLAQGLPNPPRDV